MERFFDWIEQKSEQKGSDLRTGFGTAAGYIGLFSNLILFVIKFFSGLVTGSVAVTADAMNNLSDSASSILTLVGFYFAGKPADKEHPYGHQRSEYISGLIISFIILYVGGQFLRTSIERIMDPVSPTMSTLVFVLLTVSILIKIGQGLFYQKTARHIDSKTLSANAKDSFNDVYTTLTVLISAAIEHFTGWQIDGYVGLLIAIYIIISGFKMISSFVNDLLGTRPSEEEINQMTAYLDDYQSIIGYHDLLIHSYGPDQKFASVHIEIDDSWSLNQAHDVIDDIEKKVKSNLGINLVCHLDPVAIHSEEQNYIYDKIKQILKSYQLNLKFHDFRIEMKGTHPLLTFDVVVPEDTKLTNEELLAKIEQDIHTQIGDYQTDIDFDRHYLLRK